MWLGVISYVFVCITPYQSGIPNLNLVDLGGQSLCLSQDHEISIINNHEERIVNFL